MLFVVLLAITAQPLALSAAEEKATWREKCDTFSDVAEYIMTNRQQGVSMRNTMKAVEVIDWAEEVVIFAYESPRYSTEDMQQRAIRDFTDEWYLRCVKILRNTD
jgi:hypothetical protein